MTAAKRLAELRGWFDASLEWLREAATNTPRGGDEAWLAAMRHLGAEPLPADERARHLAEGAPLRAGPLPIEYRRALEALRDRAAPLCREIDLSVADDSTQAAVDQLSRRLDSLVDAELREHLARVRPAVSTASIFANALATSQRMFGDGQAQAAGVATRQCPTCGAPRRYGSEALVCEYCGSPL